MHEQIVLLDHDARPHDVHQFALAHHPVASLDQRKQHVERARSEPRARPVDRNAALHRVDLDRAAPVGVGGSVRAGRVHGGRLGRRAGVRQGAARN
jgi:hypothetical protein